MHHHTLLFPIAYTNIMPAFLQPGSYLSTYLTGVSAVVSNETHFLLTQGIVLKKLLEKSSEFEQFIVKL